MPHNPENNSSLHSDVNVFHERGIELPNILSVSSNLEEALDLGKGTDRLYPIHLDKPDYGEATIQNSRYLFYDDPHYDEVTAYFDQLKDSAFFHDRNVHTIPNLGYSHILKLPNTLQDIQLRQDGVKELVEKTELFQAIQDIFVSLETYETMLSHSSGVHYSATLDPIKVEELLGKLSGLSGYLPTSRAVKNIINWSEGISTDSYFQHIVNKKRKVDQCSVISTYSDRFEKRVWATLKPGVQLEDFCDIIPPSGESYETTIGKGRKMKTVTRHVVHGDSKVDEYNDTIPFSRVRQRIDNIKKMASASLSVPLFLLLKQLKHLYLGAVMYQDFEKRGFPVCFPEFSDEKFDLDFTDMFPIGEVIKGQKERQGLMPNTLRFTPDEKIIHIKGANSCGKSEIFRSIHFATMLANAGFPVPASHYKTGIIPSSKFILCQGNQHSGSQLQNAKQHVFRELQDVVVGSNVVLDELGDATNGPTAAEMGKRFIPPLQEIDCRVFITSHHDALDSVIEEGGGVFLSPKQGATGTSRYEIVRIDEKVSYNAPDTLDRLGITQDSIKKVLGNRNRVSPERKIPEQIRDDDMPF